MTFTAIAECPYKIFPEKNTWVRHQPPLPLEKKPDPLLLHARGKLFAGGRSGLNEPLNLMETSLRGLSSLYRETGKEALLGKLVNSEHIS